MKQKKKNAFKIFQLEDFFHDLSDTYHWNIWYATFLTLKFNNRLHV